MTGQMTLEEFLPVPEKVVPPAPERYPGEKEWSDATWYFFTNTTDRTGRHITWSDALKITDHLGYTSPIRRLLK